MQYYGSMPASTGEGEFRRVVNGGDCGAGPMRRGMRAVNPRERRREVRRHVAYPLTVVSPTNGSKHEGRSTVEDINSRGAFFYFAQPLPEDRVVELRISLPPVGSWTQRSVEVQAEARVVRSTPAPRMADHFATAVEFIRPPTLLLETNSAF